ncbi:MAG TPA: hypothetical protein VMH20_02945 [Verrucomicrobiae bacterium]|nr:hypothetical protein [Verrucomicrobiae bacterium]
MEFITLLAPVAFTVVALYGWHSLLKTAQVREDADDERLWDYLLDPRMM